MKFFFSKINGQIEEQNLIKKFAENEIKNHNIR